MDYLEEILGSSKLKLFCRFPFTVKAVLCLTFLIQGVCRKPEVPSLDNNEERFASGWECFITKREQFYSLMVLITKTGRERSINLAAFNSHSPMLTEPKISSQSRGPQLSSFKS